MYKAGESAELNNSFGLNIRVSCADPEDPAGDKCRQRQNYDIGGDFADDERGNNGDDGWEDGALQFGWESDTALVREMALNAERKETIPSDIAPFLGK